MNIWGICHKSLTVDEQVHFEFGEMIVSGKLETAHMQKMPVSVLSVLPVFLLEKCKITLSEKGRMVFSRIPTVFASMVGAFVVFLWAKRLYGIRAGLFSLSLYIFSPTVLAHSRFVTNDIFCTTLMLTATYLFARYLDTPTFKWLLSSAIVSGLAQLAKQTSLLLFPIFLILFILHRKSHLIDFALDDSLKHKSGKLLSGFCCFTFFFLVVLFIINIGYGFKDTLLPLQHYQSMFHEETNYPTIQKTVEYFGGLRAPFPKIYLDSLGLGFTYNAQGIGHGSIYLLENLSRMGWWYYFPVAMLLKFPISFFFFLLISLLLFFKEKGRQLEKELDLLIPSIIIFTFFTFFCTAQIGVRYLLPILPFTFIFFGRIVAFTKKKRAKWLNLSVFMLLIWYIVSSLSFFPHHLSYFNEIAWDRKKIYKFLADSNVDWGQNDYYLESFLKEHKKEDIQVLPDKPSSGLVVVNINELVGISGNPEKYKWLRDSYEPAGHIAYSWLLYEIPARD